MSTTRSSTPGMPSPPCRPPNSRRSGRRWRSALTDNPMEHNPTARAGRLPTSPPRRWPRSSADTATLWPRPGERWQGARAKSAAKLRSMTPAGKSLRGSCMAAGRPVDARRADATPPRSLDRTEQNKLNAPEEDRRAADATHPGSPPRAMVLERPAEPGRAPGLPPRQPGRPGKAVPRQFLEVLSGPDAQARSRTAAAGSSWPEAIAEPEQPAHRPGDGQPGLA